MVIFRILLNTLSVMACALAGNWLGGTLRWLVTGEPVQSLQFKYENSRGKTIRNIPVVTKFYPALLISLIGRPRWLFAFIGGILIGALVDDRIEGYLWKIIDERMISGLDEDEICQDQMLDEIS